ncbi:Double-strand break repair protein MRE11A [Smittium culicis]|uniref:Double-strand break repair protein MRE11A n=1 Tax=Smittium culicis TaxID=133412 RepID=A0A1R1XV73_9FUNG|nr:Double-strand break repair protein MRE11A [Smittium culicis]
MSNIELSKVPQIKQFATEDKIINYLRSQADINIKYAATKYKEQLSENRYNVTNFLGSDPKPLIRVKVEYSGGFEPFFAHRFGLSFVDIVANPRDILLFYKNRKTKLLLENPKALTENADFAYNSDEDKTVSGNKVGKVVESFIETADLSFLVDLELNEAVRQFVDKGDNAAFSV